MAKKQFSSPFRIVSIEEVPEPIGGGKGSWYKYIVARDNSEIVGKMCGSLEKVTKYVNEFVDNLNDRSFFKQEPWTLRTTRKRFINQ